jgi:hypothetical protein
VLELDFEVITGGRLLSPIVICGVKTYKRGCRSWD